MRLETLLFKVSNRDGSMCTVQPLSKVKVLFPVIKRSKQVKAGQRVSYVQERVTR